MKKLTILLLLLSFGLSAQIRLDSAIAFQTDPAKKFSVYVPSSYNGTTPIKMMLGLHPLNTARWNAKSWCDTLVDFAEANDLLLICPDGGSDGRIDDPIDTAFTTVMLNNMMNWYNVDTHKVYAMGFSWGGKTTYTYGLNHVERFGGFMPVGAAINGAGEISAFASNADKKPFYVIHGTFDTPNTRYTPLINSLNTNGAIVKGRLLQGVGHTIDFSNRNQILSEGFAWIDSANCYQLDTAGSGSAGLADADRILISVFPNPVKAGDNITLENPQIIMSSYEIIITDTGGKVIRTETKIPNQKGKLKLNTSGLKAGNYLLKILDGDTYFQTRLSIIDN